MDTYFVNVDRHTLVDFRVVADMRLADAHDRLAVLHLHNPVAHMVALPVDSYLVADILDL